MSASLVLFFQIASQQPADSKACSTLAVSAQFQSGIYFAFSPLKNRM